MVGGTKIHQGNQYTSTLVPQGGFHEQISEQKCIFFTVLGASVARQESVSVWPIMWGATTSFKLEEWWTHECGRVVLAKTVKFWWIVTHWDPGGGHVSARISGLGGSF